MKSAYVGLAGVIAVGAVTSVLIWGNTGSDGPPTVITASPPVGPQINFSSDKPDSTFECSIDDAAWIPCQSGHIFEGENPGSHTVRVRAVDTFGRVDPTPESFSWTVPSPGKINKTPKLSLIVDVTQATAAEATVDSDPAVVAVRWSIDNKLIKTSTAPPYVLKSPPVGEHLIAAKAVISGDDSYAIAKQNYIK